MATATASKGKKNGSVSVDNHNDVLDALGLSSTKPNPEKLSIQPGFYPDTLALCTGDNDRYPIAFKAPKWKKLLAALTDPTMRKQIEEFVKTHS